MSSWTSLAIQEAQRQGCPTNIVLATVQAETGGRNISGDNGNAVGYGQVWPLWHMAAFKGAAKLLGLSIPRDTASLKKFTLANDQYSMAVTVWVIKADWNAAGGDWVRFTKMYVGAGIPQSDLERRAAIWEQYGGSVNFGTIQSTYGQYSAYTGLDTSVSDQPIAQTDYQVNPNSISKGNVLYGRRYRVIVSDSKGNALDVSQLRCVFDIEKTMLMQPNYSEISIYNLNASTENTIIKEGTRVVVEAGYEGSQYGIIFDGDIIEPIRSKEDAVNYKLTLRALDSDRFYNSGIVNFSMLRGQNSRSQIENLASKASIPTKLGSISQNMNDYKLTRGKVVFGLARDYLNQIAQSQKSTFYLDNGKINIVHAADLPKGEIIDLSPSSGLIGVPTQTEYGVDGQCLLNPLIELNSLIHIDNSLIQNAQVQIGQVVRDLDKSGIYRITKIAYKGDTRGNDWYCEFETVSQTGLLPSMITGTSGNPW